MTLDTTASMDARARREEREDRERWQKERAEMKAKYEKLHDEYSRVVKRLQLTQKALVEQQKVLDRYQHELVLCGSKLVPEDAGSNPVLKKRDAENVCNDTAANSAPKRAKATHGKQRHSMPLAERHTTTESGTHSSPSRRRSLPETCHLSSRRDVSNDIVAGDTWTARKIDMEARPKTVNVTELLRPRQPVRLPAHLNQTTASSRRRQPRGDTADSDDVFLNDRNTVGSDHMKTAVKNEAQHDDERPPRAEQPPRDQHAHAARGRRELPFKSHPSTLKTDASAPPAAATTEDDHGFAYVEVVRNRAERAALPGHDCVECRKYYDALGGMVSEHEMKAMCSRHRARFKPYQTPDDFWRLSFPDSQSEDMMSP